MHVRWRLSFDGHLRLVVYNSAGELVKILWDEDETGGDDYQVAWNQTNYLEQQVASNVYVLRASGPGLDRGYKIAVVQ